MTLFRQCACKFPVNFYRTAWYNGSNISCIDTRSISAWPCLFEILFPCPGELVSPSTSPVLYDKMLPTEPSPSRDQGACLSTSIASTQQVRCPKSSDLLWQTLHVI